MTNPAITAPPEPEIEVIGDIPADAIESLARLLVDLVEQEADRHGADG